ncbi:hypothetical protein [Actinomyces radicidentis]|uniref:hypothetical protein n=1 Tax=Actinomyces radicidentis TaxID=111015 RepID=UPI0012378A1E|nr:hypothetical protein [Actinomyces radicidentis]
MQKDKKKISKLINKSYTDRYNTAAQAARKLQEYETRLGLPATGESWDGLTTPTISKLTGAAIEAHVDRDGKNLEFKTPTDWANYASERLAAKYLSPLINLTSDPSIEYVMTLTRAIRNDIAHSSGSSGRELNDLLADKNKISNASTGSSQASVEAVSLLTNNGAKKNKSHSLGTYLDATVTTSSNEKLIRAELLAVRLSDYAKTLSA